MSEFQENLLKLDEIKRPKPEPKTTLKTVFKLGKVKGRKSKKRITK